MRPARFIRTPTPGRPATLRGRYMTPAGASEGAIPTRSQIENWNATHLENAAGRWRTSAAESEELFDRQRQIVSAPGGTEWEGTAKDAALDRITRDMSVVR